MKVAARSHVTTLRWSRNCCILSCCVSLSLAGSRCSATPLAVFSSFFHIHFVSSCPQRSMSCICYTRIAAFLANANLFLLMVNLCVALFHSDTSILVSLCFHASRNDTYCLAASPLQEAKVYRVVWRAVRDKWWQESCPINSSEKNESGAG